MDTLKASELLAALGHESRLAIFRLLVEAGSEGIHARAIGDQLALAPATLSFHLAHLSRVGLIRGRHESRFIFYSADYGAMDRLLTFLTHNCCQGRACLPDRLLENTMHAKKTVLILCTGNSCRSQMAEVIINSDMAGEIHALSAGTKPQPHVANGAIEALKQAGLPVNNLYPKDVDSVIDAPVDLVVTVCDNAKEACPVFPRPIPHLHIPFHDPHGKPLESFIGVRDDIRTRLVPAIRKALNLP